MTSAIRDQSVPGIVVLMICGVVKWTIKPERSGNWLADVEEFTQGTRSEPGNIL